MFFSNRLKNRLKEVSFSSNLWDLSVSNVNDTYIMFLITPQVMMRDGLNRSFTNDEGGPLSIDKNENISIHKDLFDRLIQKDGYYYFATSDNSADVIMQMENKNLVMNKYIKLVENPESISGLILNTDKIESITKEDLLRIANITPRSSNLTLLIEKFQNTAHQVLYFYKGYVYYFCKSENKGIVISVIDDIAKKYQLELPKNIHITYEKLFKSPEIYNYVHVRSEFIRLLILISSNELKDFKIKEIQNLLQKEIKKLSYLKTVQEAKELEVVIKNYLEEISNFPRNKNIKDLTSIPLWVKHIEIVNDSLSQLNSKLLQNHS